MKQHPEAAQALEQWWRVTWRAEWLSLRPVDLLDVFGSRAVANQVLNGHREISKTHARKLAERFKLSVAAFI